MNQDASLPWAHSCEPGTCQHPDESLPTTEVQRPTPPLTEAELARWKNRQGYGVSPANVLGALIADLRATQAREKVWVQANQELQSKVKKLEKDLHKAKEEHRSCPRWVGGNWDDF